MSVGQLDLDLVGGVGGLRHLADESARSDDGVAAAHLIDELAVRLGALLLRAG